MSYYNVNGQDVMKFQFVMLMIFLGFVYFGPEMWVPFINNFHIPFIIASITFISCLPRMKYVPKAKQNLCFLLFMVVVGMSIYNSIVIEFSKQMFVMLLKCTFLYLLAIIILKPRRNLEKCFWVILTFVSIISITTLVANKFNFVSGLGVGRYRIVSFFGGIANETNAMAALMASYLPIPLCLLEDEKSGFKKIIFIVLALSFAMCLTRTRSRGGFLGMLAVTIALIYGRKISGRRKIFFSGLICLLVGVFLYLNTHHRYIDRVLSMKSQESVQSDGSARKRLQQYEAAINLFKMKPLLGVGIGSFRKSAVYYGFMEEYRDSGMARHTVHNGYLAFLAETGILGFMFFVLIIIFSFKDLLYSEKWFRTQDKTLFLYKIAKGTRIGLIAFLVCLFFLAEQYNRVLYLMFAFSVVLKNLAIEEERRIKT